MSVQKVFLFPFDCEPRQSGVGLEPTGLQNILQVPVNRAEGCQNHDARKDGYYFSLKMNWGYISAQKLESECSKSFAVSISLQARQ